MIEKAWCPDCGDEMDYVLYKDNWCWYCPECEAYFAECPECEQWYHPVDNEVCDCCGLPYGNEDDE